jgi:O-antigen/teichoic acid export membrane protein
MARLRHNILANIAGQGWAALMQLAFVPLYLKFLGIEAYGLIGFYAVTQGILQVLDFGLSPTMMRELARYSALEEKEKEMREFVRTLEVGYWIVGSIIGVSIVYGAPYIAGSWIKAGSMPLSTVTHAVMIIGIISFFQWPLSFYQGGLMGLQRQVPFNIVRISTSTLSSAGAVLVLWLVSRSILSFFKWQILVSSLQVVALAVILWRSLPKGDRPPRINRSLLKNIWRFAAGMSGISVTAIILTQMDKVVLSKMLTLEQFGYYVLASVVAGGLGMITAPLFNALFPHFTALATQKNDELLKSLYHRSSQTMAVLLIPPAAVIAFFSPDVIFAWTGNAVTAHNTFFVLRLLIIGTALNGIMNLPYALQLAHGWTSLGLRINLFFIATMLPLLILFTSQFGPVGAAAVWMTLNIVYVVIGVPLTHRRLLKGEAARWFVEDIGYPLLAAVLIAAVGRIAFAPTDSRLLSITILLIVLLAAFAGSAALAKDLRSWILQKLLPHLSKTN